MASINECLSGANPGNQCPPENSLLNFFTELAICGQLTIPEQKPDVETISNVTKDFKIEDVEVLDVNLGDVQGRKVVVAGTLTLGVEYSALIESQEVHFAHFDLPFKVIIKMRPCPGAYRGLLPPDFNISDYNVLICLEHEQYHVLDPRNISAVLVVLVWLQHK